MSDPNKTTIEFSVISDPEASVLVCRGAFEEYAFIAEGSTADEMIKNVRQQVEETGPELRCKGVDNVHMVFSGTIEDWTPQG